MEDLKDEDQAIYHRTLSAYVNHSGGATGADFAWDAIGREFGMIKNRHYWFKEPTPYGNTEISQADAIEGQVKSTLAARQLGRIDSEQQVRDPRIIRDWAQVKYAEAIFAIGHFIEAGEKLIYGKTALIRQVKGGTGYTVQMGINEGKKVYVFDQELEKWFRYAEGEWFSTEVPILTKNFAGIGTRKLNERGEKGIREVYQKTSDTLKG